MKTEPNMNENTESPKEPTSTGQGASHDLAKTARASVNQQTPRGWWLHLITQPLLFLAVGALLLAALGVAQRAGWVSSGGGGHVAAGGADATTRYICPMMCTPPQSEPGRCPVCAMELVPASAGGGGDERSVELDPASRRVANIQTAVVQSVPLERTIRAVGELSYDEGSLKTLSAYVDGRLDRLFADYTGAVVEKGDHLALVYSPRLYSAQTELLLARQASDRSQNSTLRRVADSNLDLYRSAKQRLIELGMTESQIAHLEAEGEANSRLHLCAPISGTVIEKFAVEGQYVKEGQAIYNLADLSTVWLMMELFPEDAVTVRYGQKVEAEVQSLPGRRFTGRVAFVDPTVDPRKRTVGVRVVMSNADGLLRVGDYAKASIRTPAAAADRSAMVYDPELADKWISPRHPHIVSDSPGACSVCGVDLVPASQLGFTAEPTAASRVLVVPRSAVLMNSGHSVLYAETEPGRFEIRLVKVGSSRGDQLVIHEGVEEGERVATAGSFLIDSQMQLAGNPSLIDPTRALPGVKDDLSPEALEALAKLPPHDRELATKQRICPVTRMLLGSMGTPPKVEVDGRFVFLCCMGCDKRLQDNPEKYLANLEAGAGGGDTEEEAAVAEALAGLSPEDRALAEKQRFCPVADFRLGGMGTPVKVDVQGTPVFLCCNGCREAVLAEPEKYLAKLEEGPPDDGLSAPELPPMGTFTLAGPAALSASGASEKPASDNVREAFAGLSEVDRQLASIQRACPVTELPLGSMGVPVKVELGPRTVFLCCEGCRGSLLAEPAAYLARLDALLGEEALR